MTLQIDDSGELGKLLQLLPEAIDTFRQIQILKDCNLTARWYDLKTCFSLRGVGSFLTFKNNRWYQPKGGIPDEIIQGRHAWSRETVAEWLTYTDKTLADYHKKYCTGAKNPHGE
jgi:hypothetical protein